MCLLTTLLGKAAAIPGGLSAFHKSGIASISPLTQGLGARHPQPSPYTWGITGNRKRQESQNILMPIELFGGTLLEVVSLVILSALPLNEGVYIAQGALSLPRLFRSCSTEDHLVSSITCANRSNSLTWAFKMVHNRNVKILPRFCCCFLLQTHRLVEGQTFHRINQRSCQVVLIPANIRNLWDMHPELRVSLRNNPPCEIASKIAREDEAPRLRRFLETLNQRFCARGLIICSFSIDHLTDPPV